MGQVVMNDCREGGREGGSAREVLFIDERSDAEPEH